MTQKTEERMAAKSTVGALESELASGYGLSPVEARVLAQRVCELVAEQSGLAREPGQITYQAIALDEPAGKALRDCRKVPVHLTLVSEEDQAVWAQEGAEAQRRQRVRRLVYEAYLQEGALSQEDLAYLLGTSTRTIKRVFGWYRAQGQRLPSRGELQDMGRGVSHKIPVIRQYVHDLSFTQISRGLGDHGVASMARYLRHFALVMLLTDRGMSAAQMASIVKISEGLLREYQQLYHELNVAEHQRTLSRLKGAITAPAPAEPLAEDATSAKGGR
jgi:transposase